MTFFGRMKEFVTNPRNSKCGSLAPWMDPWTLLILIINGVNEPTYDSCGEPPRNHQKCRFHHQNWIWPSKILKTFDLRAKTWEQDWISCKHPNSSLGPSGPSPGRPFYSPGNWLVKACGCIRRPFEFYTPAPWAWSWRSPRRDSFLFETPHTTLFL